MSTKRPGTAFAPDAGATLPVALREVHRGMAFGFLAPNGYYDLPETQMQPARMAALNVKWVSVIVTVFQDAYYSTRVYKDFRCTPNDAEVERIVDRIHAAGMRVMLYPNLEMHDSQWRGRVDFPPPGEQIQGLKVDYWKPWFESYTDCLLNYARLAQRKNAELYCLGPEMSGTVKQAVHWENLIGQVRKAYAGPLIYEAHGRDLENPAPWFSKLDLLGYSFYRPSADRPGLTVPEMVAFLRPAVEKCRQMSQKVGKPVVFTEAGCLARRNATLNPGNWHEAGEYDGREQAKWLEAVWTAFRGEPWWRGLYWWKWDEQQNRPQYKTDPAGDQGFTLQGKPAAAAMRRIYGDAHRPRKECLR